MNPTRPSDSDAQSLREPILLGLILFIGTTGGAILNPVFTDWIYPFSDPATMQLGWDFFRNAPLLQWPLGLNPDYGVGLSNSIVYTDSIPLVAVLLKPLSPLLPTPFQYFGLWILIVQVLQTCFAWRLLSLFTKERVLLVLASSFFVLAPAMLIHLHFHYALYSMWGIIAAFYLYFAKPFRPVCWAALLIVTVLINPYHFVMAGAILTASLIHRFWTKTMSFREALTPFLITALIAPPAMEAMGFFTIGESPATSGYGWYRSNLLTLFDPGQSSLLLPDIHNGKGNNGGYNYLGLGMILLAAVAALRIPSPKSILRHLPLLLPISVMVLGMFAYSVTNRISVGEYDLLMFRLPEFTEPLTRVFRASSRFCWPLYFLIYTGVLTIIITRFKRSTAAWIIGAALVLQIIDFSPQLRFLHANLLTPPKWESPMRAPLWKTFTRQYRHVAIWPYNPESWAEWGQFASSHKMTVNTGYFGRASQQALREGQDRLRRTILFNTYQPDTLYAFDPKRAAVKDASYHAMWHIANHQASADDLIGELDGLRILAPGFLKAHPSTPPPGKPKPVLPDVSITLEAPVSFSSGRNPHLVYGWEKSPSGEGVSSRGGKGGLCVILLTLKDRPAKAPAKLGIQGSNLRQAKVYVNTVPLEKLAHETEEDLLFITLSPEFCTQAQDRITLVFEASEAPVGIRQISFTTDSNQ